MKVSFSQQRKTAFSTLCSLSTSSGAIWKKWMDKDKPRDPGQQ